MNGDARDETFRATMQARTADGEACTLIVTRQGVGRQARTWVTLAGSSLRCTAVLDGRDVDRLTELLAAATGRGTREEGTGR